MNTKYSFAAAVLSLLAVTAGQAQTTAPATVPANRAVVKAEAASAVKAGTTNLGQRATKDQDKGTRRTPSVESRTEVKAETRAANRAGTLPKGEEGVAGQNRGAVAKQAPSTNSRADVKADARAAVKAGTLPKGEEGVPDQNKGARTPKP